MRLALIGPVYPYRGGIAHYTTRLAQTLRQVGHELLLVSFKRQYPQRLFPGQSDRDPSTRPVKAPDAHYWLDSLNPLTWLTTFRRIRAWQPQATILQWWTPFWAPTWFTLGMLNRFSLHRPLIVICHNVLPHEPAPWDPPLARLVLRRGTAFIVQSQEEKERLLTLLPEARIEVCHLPPFDLLTGQRRDKAQARERLRLPQKVPILLFFGIVREYKGLHDLLAAMPRIRERLGTVLLVVAGEFWDDRESYLAEIRRMGIEGAVLLDSRYIPNEEVALYFSAADLLVAPYRRVTGSASVQMAVGFGLPVVTTRIGSLAETDGGGFGLLVPPGDPDALAEAVIAFFEEKKPTSPPAPRRGSWERLAATVEALVREGTA